MINIDKVMATELKDNLIDTHEKENSNPRAIFYKKPIKRDNYNLDVDNIDTFQEIRRRRLLQFQKKYVSCINILLYFTKNLVNIK